MKHKANYKTIYKYPVCGDKNLGTSRRFRLSQDTMQRLEDLSFGETGVRQLSTGVYYLSDLGHEELEMVGVVLEESFVYVIDGPVSVLIPHKFKPDKVEFWENSGGAELNYFGIMEWDSLLRDWVNRCENIASIKAINTKSTEFVCGKYDQLVSAYGGDISELAPWMQALTMLVEMNPNEALEVVFDGVVYRIYASVDFVVDESEFHIQITMVGDEENTTWITQDGRQKTKITISNQGILFSLRNWWGQRKR